MATFESVASTVISSSTPMVTFSNINSSNLYDHFLLAFYYQASGSGGTNVLLRLNSDSTNSYNYLRTMVAGSSSVSAVIDETFIDIADVGGSEFNSASVWIIGAQTNKRKNLYSQGSTDGTQRAKFNFGQYMSNNSISSVSVFMGDGKNTISGTVALYGIRGA